MDASRIADRKKVEYEVEVDSARGRGLNWPVSISKRDGFGIEIGRIILSSIDRIEEGYAWPSRSSNPHLSRAKPAPSYFAGFAYDDIVADTHQCWSANFPTFSLPARCPRSIALFFHRGNETGRDVATLLPRSVEERSRF